MSLLDDVSIVVTPNGYKAGELYAVVPVPTEGTEEVVNGDFATDTNWTKAAGWTISGGSANSDGSQSAASGLVQSSVFTSGKRYKLSFNITSNGDVFKFWVNGSQNIFSTSLVDGLIEYIFIASATGSAYFESTSTFIGSISNVSVKEYTAADMDVTRATAATRVDENGLVNYAEIVGGEEVTCGDFSCAVPTDVWTTQTGWTFSGGTANANVSGSEYIYQNISMIIGTTYEVTYDIVSYTSGQIRIEVSSTETGLYRSSLGTFTEYLTPLTQTLNRPLFRNTAGGGFVGSIDNVSVKEVIRDNVPRIDYTGGGCPHILAEPQRKNLVTYSSDLTNAFYQLSGIEVVTESAISSPDGTSYGYTIVPTSATSSHYFNYDYTNLTVAIGVDVTYSIFIKPNGYNFIQIASSTGFASKFQNFELTGDGVIGTGDVDGKTIERIGDYYKISVTQVSITANPRFLLIPSPTALATRNPSFTGNGTDGVLGWGVQIEVGSYPTSLIPTSGSTVTRNQDQFTRDGIGSLINSTEGVLFVEMAALSDDGTDRKFSISDGTSSNVISIVYRPTSNQVRGAIITGGVNQVLLSFVVTDATAFNKIAFKWKAGDFALWVGGVQVVTSSSGSIPTGLNKISNDNGGGNFYMYSKVKQLQVYKTALTDEQLIQLTGESGTDFYESYAEMAAALNYTIQ